MNLLIFEKKEQQGNLLYLHDRRADHIQKILRLQEGDQLRVGELNGCQGIGTIKKITNAGVILELDLATAANCGPDITLILALPRPIMLKRILKQATTLGVKEFHLIRTRRVEKSFFHSPVLKPDNIREILIQALEQSMDTRLPEVHIHTRFKPFVEDVLPALPGNRLLAHPGANSTLYDCLAPEKNKKSAELHPVLLAVGPEGGFVDYECDRFMEQNFTIFSMGPRILHVDTAVVALLAQVQLLLAASVTQQAGVVPRAGAG